MSNSRTLVFELPLVVLDMILLSNTSPFFSTSGWDVKCILVRHFFRLSWESPIENSFPQADPKILEGTNDRI